MKKFEIDITTSAKTTQVVEAPDRETAIKFLKENLYYNGLNWEVDEMDAEVDCGKSRDGHWYGIQEVAPSKSADMKVNAEWLEGNGYEIVVRKQQIA